MCGKARETGDGGRVEPRDVVIFKFVAIIDSTSQLNLALTDLFIWRIDFFP